MFVTPWQPEIKSKLSKSLNNINITYKSLYFLCATLHLYNLKSVLTKLFNATLIQPDFFTLSENDFRGLHLHNLKSLRRYHCTLHSHNLTFTTSVKFDFRILHLHNLKSLSTIWLYTTLAQPDFHYICTTWFQGSTLAQPEIFISMVKWNISRCTRNPNFNYIRKKWFLWPFSFLLCVCFLTCTVHISYLYLCLN